MNGESCASVMRFTTGHDGGREGSTQVVGRGPKCGGFPGGKDLDPAGGDLVGPGSPPLLLSPLGLSCPGGCVRAVSKLSPGLSMESDRNSKAPRSRQGVGGGVCVLE